MAAEYVCSACGYTFHTEGPAADGCPACGADASKFWRVGARTADAAAPRAEGASPGPPIEPAGAHEPKDEADRSAARASPRPRRRRRGLALPWRRLRIPPRRSLILALILALWPWPLDDDRLPHHGPSRSATGDPAGVPVAAGGSRGETRTAGQSFGAAGTPGGVAGSERLAGTAPAGAGWDGRTAGPLSPATAAPRLSGGSPAGRQPPTGGPGSASDASLPAAGHAATAPVSPSAPGQGAGGLPVCLPADTRRLVYLLDVSVSMGLPHDIGPASEDSLDAAIDNGDLDALDRYRDLLGRGGLTRLQLAKQAFGEALDETPPGVEVGLVSFHGCDDIHRYGPVERSGFGTLLESAKALQWHRGGDTALSASLAEAYAMIGAVPGRVVVITDGKDTCGPPPCEIIARLSVAQPRVRVDVVDVSGRSETACLARATGGSVRIAPLSGAVGAFTGAVRQLATACRPGDRP